jgi:hypothetical protein
LGKRQSRSNRDSTSLNAIAEKPLGTEMLTTSSPPAYASLLAHDLGNETLNIVSPGQVVSMAAVVAKQQITFLQGRSDGNP